MKNSVLAAGVAIAGVLLPGAASADVSLALTGGTTGVGGEARVDLSDHFALRATATTLSWDVDETYDEISYTGDLNYAPVGLILDYHPFGNGFHVSGGALLGGPELDLTARPTVVTEIGGTLYTPAQIGTMDVEAEISDTAPFVGFGWVSGRRSGSHLSFALSAGVAFYDDAQARLTARDGLLANNAQFLTDLQEEQDLLEEELDQFKTYPVIAASLGYRF